MKKIRYWMDIAIRTILFVAALVPWLLIWTLLAAIFSE